MHGVWDSRRRSVPTNPPLLKQQGHMQEKQEAMNQRLEWKVSLFYTPSTERHQYPPPFQPKRGNMGARKKKRPTLAARKKEKRLEKS